MVIRNAFNILDEQSNGVATQAALDKIIDSPRFQAMRSQHLASTSSKVKVKVKEGDDNINNDTSILDQSPRFVGDDSIAHYDSIVTLAEHHDRKMTSAKMKQSSIHTSSSDGNIVHSSDVDRHPNRRLSMETVHSALSREKKIINESSRVMI